MICVSIQEKDYNKCREILKGCHMAELRADLCQFSIKQIEEIVSSHPNILITSRICNSTAQIAREQICAAIRKGAKYADVEIEAPMEHLEYIKSYARVNGCKLIISYHNFEGTQSLSELQAIYDLCRRKGADIVKIVTTANTTEDAVRVMQLYNYKKSDREIVPDNYMERGEESGSLSNSFGQEQALLVAFCMGEAGKFTRHLSLDLGSPYTYASLEKGSATAPGQYTKEEMEHLLDTASYPVSTFKLQQTLLDGENPKTTIPCSKSIAQRAILAAAICNGESILQNFEPCNDTAGAIEVIKKLGAYVSIQGSTLKIVGKGAQSLKSLERIEVGESGLLTRLLIPLAAYLSNSDNEIEITGCGSILKRKLSESQKALEAAGAVCKSNEGYLPFRVSGGIKNCNIEFSGKESSQIVSGFLMTLPLLEQDTTLTVTNPTSIPYITLTLKTLEWFGIDIQAEQGNNAITYRIKGGQNYTPAKVYLDSDWSSAAYFAVAGALHKGITLKNMPYNSAQADESILNLLKKYGAEIKVSAAEDNLYNELKDITVCTISQQPDNVEADLTNSPDLFPIAAVLAHYANCSTTLKGVGRLAQKESNRAQTVYSELTKLGASINIDNNNMYISGCGKQRSGKADIVNTLGHNDHRIAMSLYIASIFTDKIIKIDSTKCIDKSFPTFVEKLRKQ